MELEDATCRAVLSSDSCGDDVTSVEVSCSFASEELDVQFPVAGAGALQTDIDVVLGESVRFHGSFPFPRPPRGEGGTGCRYWLLVQPVRERVPGRRCEGC